MPLTVRRSKSELCFRSEQSLDPALRTTVSQEYTEQVQLVMVDRTARSPGFGQVSDGRAPTVEAPLGHVTPPGDAQRLVGTS